MTDFYTDMSTLMTAIKNRLLAYQGTTLSSIKTWKRGVLPPMIAFPALTILPVNEVLYKPRSGGVYRNDRTLNIEIYTKGLDTATILRNNMDITEAVKDVLKTEYQMDDTEKNTYDVVIGQQVYGEAFPYKTSSLLQKSLIPITCKSLETFATGTRSLSVTDTSSKDILDEIYNVVSAYSYSTSVKKFGKATMPPCMSYPSIHVMEDIDLPERYETGIDRPNRVFNIMTFNKQLDKEVLLDNLITIVENIKDCLQEAPTFSGKARNSWVSGVEYGSYQSGGTLLYSAFITLNVLCYDPVR